jgi:hypothetical protein
MDGDEAVTIAEWSDAKLLRAVDRSIAVGLQQSAAVIVNQAKRNLSTPGLSKTAIRGLRLLDSLAERGRDTVSGLLAIFGRNRNTGRLRSRSGRGQQLREALAVKRLGEVNPPGGFPRMRTGTLRRSIAQELIPRGPGQPVEVLVGSTMNPVTGYAFAQEFGSPKLKLPARPYMRPAFEATLSEQAAVFERAAAAEMARQVAG